MCNCTVFIWQLYIYFLLLTVYERFSPASYPLEEDLFKCLLYLYSCCWLRMKLFSPASCPSPEGNLWKCLLYLYSCCWLTMKLFSPASYSHRRGICGVCFAQFVLLLLAEDEKVLCCFLLLSCLPVGIDSLLLPTPELPACRYRFSAASYPWVACL